MQRRFYLTVPQQAFLPIRISHNIYLFVQEFICIFSTSVKSFSLAHWHIHIMRSQAKPPFYILEGLTHACFGFLDVVLYNL